MSTIEAEWLRVSEEINALDYLEQAVTFTRNTTANPMAWKWVVIALHGAVYGFAIRAAHGTSYEGITYVTNKGERKLISFGQALELCQDPTWMQMTFNRKPLVLSEQQKQSIDLLQKEYRNNFEHFVPAGWSIELHDMPYMTIDALQVVHILALELGAYTRFTDKQQERIRQLVAEGVAFLKQTKLYTDCQS